VFAGNSLDRYSETVQMVATRAIHMDRPRARALKRNWWTRCRTRPYSMAYRWHGRRTRGLGLMMTAAAAKRLLVRGQQWLGDGTQILARGTTRPPEGLHCVLVGATCMPIRTIYIHALTRHTHSLCVFRLVCYCCSLSSCCVSCMCIFVACFIPPLGALICVFIHTHARTHTPWHARARALKHTHTRSCRSSSVTSASSLTLVRHELVALPALMAHCDSVCLTVRAGVYCTC
jgi:hypothetical protein